MVTWIPLAVAGVAAFCLVVAAIFAKFVLKADPGNEKMQEISKAVQEGARAFIRREYGYVAIFMAIMVVLISVALRNQNGWQTALCYVFGALCSLTAGFVGLSVSTRANCRTTEAARGGVSGALTVAFRSGAVMGLTVAGLGLLGLTICYIIFEVVLGMWNSANIVLGFSLGASSVALFARVGGGIFTKAADVGADLVGKVETGIPEDDPRNPAVIADQVGDNVGDVAGMGADLYESYVAAIIAPIAIASSGLVFQKLGAKAMVLPLAVTGAGVICSILGTLMVRTKSGGRAAQRALTWSTYAAAALATISSFFLVWGISGWKNIGLFYSLLMGIVSGIVIGLVSEYFTSDHYKPVREIAKSAQTGAATLVIRGLAVGMLSTVVPVVAVAIAMSVSFWTGNRVFPGGGVYCVGLAALGMLCTTGMVVSVDAYGPVADNAGGIAEMAGLEPEVREITDNLDSVGNTTAAIGKGFAIGAAALAALALFSAFAQATGLSMIDIIGDYKFMAGLLVGGVLPFVFSALCLNAVGRAASAVVEEVRKQFREISGLKEGVEGVRPDYARCVDMTTKTAIYEMLLPGSLAIVTPLLIGRFMGKDCLAGFLAGALISGFILAIMMANAGGAWDNAKKYIEGGAYGGKGTAAHAAAVIGDTIGDPFKDTSGPAMNILIKVMTVVSLLFVPLFIK
ncbi:MAG: sodium-translocating pyrophosphatase [Candidatus Anoxymicrobium japonicum]|uniref:Putative K(+)-stimulated pyrophosphate-energized sodium pump n=1 Tax=Candidatus Anoxymicrobium japonicum TaxID=2013648 RepID=A0A2N3G412_9ACTN|nr:MAG: sodium-translocating pyrophosphatase [Candidatus Anoxymicrobium japonicum]